MEWTQNRNTRPTRRPPDLLVRKKRSARRQGVKGIVAVCGAGALLFSAPARAGFTITDLGVLPGGNFSIAYALSDSGTVAGSANARSYTPVVWTSGAAPPQIMSGVPAGASAAYGINNAGQIVGGNSAFLWSPGSGYQNISAGGNFYVARDINNLGVAVGDGAGLNGTAAYEWNATSGAHPLMGPSVTGSSHATALNDAGQITGYVDGVNYSTAYVYNPGDTTFHTIGTLPNAGFTDSYGLAINALGQVAGYSGNGANSRFGFIWSPTTGMVDIGDLPGGDTYSVALGINDAGLVVGNSGAPGGRHAFLWSSVGGMVDLNNEIDNANGFTVSEADAINNLGYIVGYGTTLSGATHAFLLTPDDVGAVPEPATWAMMLLGFGAIGVATRRKGNATRLPQLA